MKYYIDTHDKKKGSFLEEKITSKEFVKVYKNFDDECEKEGVTALGAHVNLEEGKAFCFTTGPDTEAVRRAHEAIINLYSSCMQTKKWR